MNVTLDKTDNVSAVLNVSIEENDYKPEVEKKLRKSPATPISPDSAKVMYPQA